MSRDAREHRKVIIEPLWATDENKTENRWVRKKKNRERTKTNNCALASRNSSSDHVPSPRPPITVYILPFTKDLNDKNFKLSHSVTFYIWRPVRNYEQSLSPLRDSGATERRQCS